VKESRESKNKVNAAHTHTRAHTLAHRQQQHFIIMPPTSAATTRKLEQYLLRELPAVSDAEAEPLAQYVLTLLQRDESGDVLLHSCCEELEEFLLDHTKPFVQKLLAYAAKLNGVAAAAAAAAAGGGGAGGDGNNNGHNNLFG
jgi:hypothetical protein